MKANYFVAILSLTFCSIAFADSGNPTELPEIITVVLGVLAPIIIQFVTRKVTDEMLRYLIALFLSGIIGLLALLISGQPLEMTPEYIIKLFAYASIAYKLFWKPLWSDTRFEAKPTIYKFKK